jgi:hypothetical protein
MRPADIIVSFCIFPIPFPFFLRLYPVLILHPLFVALSYPLFLITSPGRHFTDLFMHLFACLKAYSLLLTRLTTLLKAYSYLLVGLTTLLKACSHLFTGLTTLLKAYSHLLTRLTTLLKAYSHLLTRPISGGNALSYPSAPLMTRVWPYLHFFPDEKVCE